MTREQGNLFHSCFFTQHGFSNAVIHFLKKKKKAKRLTNEEIDFLQLLPLPAALSGVI